jgi:hypothetical protein
VREGKHVVRKQWRTVASALGSSCGKAAVFAWKSGFSDLLGKVEAGAKR